MKLIQAFAALAMRGISFNLKIASAGSGDKIQLDILPTGQDAKTGHGLPAKALIGTAQEIDEGLPAFLQDYLASVDRVDATFKETVSEITKQEEEAKAAAKAKAEAAKATAAAKSSSAKAASPAKPGKTAKPARDMSAGFLGADDEDDEGDSGTDGSDSSQVQQTTTASATAAVDEAAPAAAKDTLTPDLFV